MDQAKLAKGVAYDTVRAVAGMNEGDMVSSDAKHAVERAHEAARAGDQLGVKHAVYQALGAELLQRELGGRAVEWRNYCAPKLKPREE